MPVSQRNQRKMDSKQQSSSSTNDKTKSNDSSGGRSNIWILIVAFIALILYSLYNSIGIYTKERMTSDFE